MLIARRDKTAGMCHSGGLQLCWADALPFSRLQGGCGDVCIMACAKFDSELEDFIGLRIFSQLL